MKRYLCWLAVLGIASVPDWASAFQPCWAPPPPPCVPYGPPVGYMRPLVFVQPCIPVYEVPLPGPQVYPIPPATVSGNPRSGSPRPVPVATTPPTPVFATPTSAPPTPIPAAVSGPASAPTRAIPITGGPVAPVVTPGRVENPTPAPRTPSVAPAGLITPPGVPEVPTPKTPQLTLPPHPSAIDPPPVMPIPHATPTPAPGSDSSLVIPPASPMIPVPAEPKKLTDAGGESLPPLVLPPEGPGGPSGVVPPTVVRSSPLTGAGKTQVYPVSGNPGPGGMRKIGFFNHTERDINLTIEGHEVKLPRKSYLHAQVPPTFHWMQAGNPATKTTVPDGAAGVDVLFRE